MMLQQLSALEGSGIYLPAQSSDWNLSIENTMEWNVRCEVDLLCFVVYSYGV